MALAIAGIGDLLDMLIVGAVPGVGEPFDVIIALVNSYLLKDPKPMIGLIEASSIVPPLAVVDFIPVHSIIAWYTIREQRKGR